MSLPQPSLPSPAYTPDNHPLNHVNQHAILTTEEERKKVRDQVENRLSQLSQDLYELEICAGAVIKGQEDRIPEYMKKINQQFIHLHELALQMQPRDNHGSTVLGDSVPRQVVENVDGYRNPHMYTKNALSRATGENQYALGRILGLESFRRQLSQELGKEMPDLPIPPRRHRPEKESDGSVNQSTQSSGHGQNDIQLNGQGQGDGVNEREVKVEEMVNGV